MPDEELAEWLSDWRAAYSVLSMQSGAEGLVPIAVLLLDISQNRLLFRFRDDLGKIATEESVPILEGMRDELAKWVSENGATSVYLMFLDTLSNAIRISDPREVPPEVDLADYLDRVFAQEITNAGFAAG